MVTSARPSKALLVEDSEQDALLITERLNSFAPGEFQIDHVSTLREGMERVSAERYSAVVLDLHLPDVSGPEVWRELRSGAGSTPVVVLTAAGDAFVEEQAVEEGVQDFLLKADTSGPALVRALRHAIARESRLAELRKQHLELMATEARIRNLVVSSAEGLAVVDRSGTVLFINEQGARWAGLTLDGAAGARFPLEIPLKRAAHADVVVDGSDHEAFGLKHVRFVRLELRAVPSTWAGKPVNVMTMRDVTEQESETTRLELLTELDRAIAAKAGDVDAVCETVADHLPRLVPYQQIEIALSKFVGSPANVVMQRGRIERLDGRTASSPSPEGDRVSIPLGDEIFSRGWIAVSSRRAGVFDERALKVLQHVAALMSASLGLLGPRLESN